MWAILFLFFLPHQSLTMTTVQWTVVRGLKYATYQETLIQITKETCLDSCTKVRSIFLEVKIINKFCKTSSKLGAKQQCFMNVPDLRSWLTVD